MAVEYFPPGTIPYRPFSSPDDDVDDDGVENNKNDIDSTKKYLCYRHYNANEIIMGKSMKEWCKFSICFWHTLNGSGGSDPFGMKTLKRPWDDNESIDNTNNNDPMTIAKRRIDVLFELLVKLGVEYYTFHDIDIAPEGKTLQETLDNLDCIVNYIIEKQHNNTSIQHIQLLWCTQNLFSHVRYMNGAMTNPNINIYCYAAAQIQKIMDINYKLHGQNHVFWGGREGYQTLLNTNMKQECDQMAQMYHMAVAYKEKMNYTAQFLIEPKPCEPMKHQYDYDAATTIGFLHQYNLQDHFKLNIEPNHTTLAGHAAEHDIVFAAAYNMLGSIDANTGDTALGWDTDQFPMNVQDTTAIMYEVIKMGGFTTGGLNFDCKVRRESIDPIDLMYGHIGAIDTYAFGLRKAARLYEKKVLQQLIDERYLSWSNTEMGQNIMNGNASLEDCTQYALTNPEPQPKSGKQELYEIIRNTELYRR